jgi:hypothetical protein
VDEMNLYEKIRSIITDPHGFYNSVKADTGYSDPWLYYIIIMGVYYFVSMCVAVPLAIQSYGSEMNLFGNLGLGLYIAMNIGITFLMYLFSMAGIFIGAGIIHVLLMLVGSNKGYQETFKLVAYSSTPLLMLAPFLILNAVPVIGGLILFIFMILAYIYMAYLEVVGAVILHEISTKRAVIGIIVIPLAILMIIIAILAVFFVGLLAVIMSASPEATGMFTSVL